MASKLGAFCNFLYRLGWLCMLALLWLTCFRSNMNFALVLVLRKFWSVTVLERPFQVQPFEFDRSGVDVFTHRFALLRWVTLRSAPIAPVLSLKQFPRPFEFNHFGFRKFVCLFSFPSTILRVVCANSKLWNFEFDHQLWILSMIIFVLVLSYLATNMCKKKGCGNSDGPFWIWPFKPDGAPLFSPPGFKLADPSAAF